MSESLPVIDAHLHLWDPTTGWYDSDDDLAPVDRRRRPGARRHGKHRLRARPDCEIRGRHRRDLTIIPSMISAPVALLPSLTRPAAAGQQHHRRDLPGRRS